MNSQASRPAPSGAFEYLTDSCRASTCPAGPTAIAPPANSCDAPANVQCPWRLQARPNTPFSTQRA